MSSWPEEASELLDAAPLVHGDDISVLVLGELMVVCTLAPPVRGDPLHHPGGPVEHLPELSICAPGNVTMTMTDMAVLHCRVGSHTTRVDAVRGSRFRRYFGGHNRPVRAITSLAMSTIWSRPVNIAKVSPTLISDISESVIHQPLSGRTAPCSPAARPRGLSR
ncbi:hypothetical protein [Pseudonocardia sp.]|uniref:hypothetical protein n=1 Tax=Pseudonocardia sp. TaxID=60912 RepID=UPI00261AC53E|nr:hypothetical protein [Pseudonocardia sp.]